MKVKAQDVRPGDRIQGIGIVVSISEPHSDYFTNIEGEVGHGDDQNPVKVVLPNDHMVRVSRPFQTGDEVTVPVTEANDDDFGSAEYTSYAKGTVVEVSDSGAVVAVGGYDDKQFPFKQIRHAHA